MGGSRDDAARLRTLLDIANAAGTARAVDDLVRRACAEARQALDARTVSVEIAPSPGESRVLAGLSLSVPVMVDGRLWGRLTAARLPGQEHFLPDDLDFAAAVAAQVAAGVAQAERMAHIERLAFEDGLTGLANRRAVDDRLEVDLAAHTASGLPVAVVLADINRLKQTNDAFGHDAGDRLIVAVASAVKESARLAPGSLAARIGGDEFCVVVTGAPETAAVSVAEELCRLVDAQPMSTGVSCGVASTQVRGAVVDSPARLLRLADAAQYRAKRSGSRGPVVAGSVHPLEDDVAAGDRRSRRGRLGTEPSRALATGLDALDAVAGQEAQRRLETVGRHVSGLVDGSGWWLSRADLEAGVLRVLANSVQRTGHEAYLRAAARVGAVFALGDYPATERAIRDAASFAVEVGSADNDAAEETELAAAGYTSAIGAGALDTPGACQGWLLEVFGDSLSIAVPECEDLLRALVSVAVAGAGRGDCAAPPVPPARDGRAVRR